VPGVAGDDHRHRHRRHDRQRWGHHAPRAITAANTNAASGDAPAGDAGLDTIAFNIPGAGPHTITPTSPLPNIIDAVTINGVTEPGFAGTPVVVLNGGSAGVNANGLTLTVGGSTVQGLVIQGFQGQWHPDHGQQRHGQRRAGQLHRHRRDRDAGGRQRE